MLFESERLSFRPWRSEDLSAIAGLLQDPETMHHWPAPLDDDAVAIWLTRNVTHFEQHGFSRFCTTLRGTDTVVGDVGMVQMEVRGRPAVDLGYIIHADYWQQGYGSEAAAAVVNWLRSQKNCLGVETIVATMATNNTGSAAVARGLGMRLIETFHNPKNQDKETYYFELSMERA